MHPFYHISPGESSGAFFIKVFLFYIYYKKSYYLFVYYEFL